MRSLIHILNHPREERGVSAVFFGLSLTLIMGAVGLSTDVGNVAYRQNQAQHAADAAARHLAFQCAKSPSGAMCSSLQASAATIAADRFSGGTVSASRVAADGDDPAGVSVSVAKSIDTPLMSFFGVTSKDVLAEATAKVGIYHPTEVLDVFPLGVGYCTYKNNSGSAGTPTESSNRINLRTDTLQSVRTLLSPLTGTLSTVVATDWLLNALDTKATESCTDVDGTQLLTFKGGTWLTGENVVGTVLSGLFNWNGPQCELDVDHDLSTFLGGVEGAAFFPSACASRFGTDITVGKTILLPVYKPHTNTANLLGLKGTACVGLGSKPGTPSTCVEIPPKIGVEIVGFAPFTVTGWTFPSTGGVTDSSVGCAPTTLSLTNLRNLVNGTLTLVESVLNLVLSLLAPLTGTLTTSLACNGLQGYFSKSFTKDPNATYSTGGTDLGATFASLTD